jgi:hypothetical protein
VEYAPLMYKVIMRLATIDSVATTQTLWYNLQNLGTFAAMVSCDIDKIISKFDQNYSQIIAQGATVDDPIGIIFEAYSIIPCYNFTPYMKRQHDDYLDGKLTVTHEALMASEKAKMDYLKLKGKWGAKSPDDKKIVAMAAEINALKGQLKLNPKLSAIAKEGKKKGNRGDKSEKGKKWKNKKNTSNKKDEKRDETWKQVPPKEHKKKKKKLESTLTIGASTIWRGRSTSLLIVSLARSTRTTRGRTVTRPTLPLLPQQPLPSTLAAALLATLANIKEE